MIDIIMLDPRADPEMLGYLPGFLSENDPRSAREQLDANYQHGGGWNPLPGWKIVNPLTASIQYPGDPKLHPFAMAVLHGTEQIFFYRHAQVAIIRSDGSFEIARLD